VHLARDNYKQRDNWRPGQDYDGTRDRGAETGRPGKSGTGGNRSLNWLAIGFFAATPSPLAMSESAMSSQQGP